QSNRVIYEVAHRPTKNRPKRKDLFCSCLREHFTRLTEADTERDVSSRQQQFGSMSCATATQAICSDSENSCCGINGPMTDYFGHHSSPVSWNSEVSAPIVPNSAISGA